MTDRLHAPHTVSRDSLPPAEVRAYDPSRYGMLPTPLDERGLVDLDGLVMLAKSTVDPEYTWQSSFNDVHHLQWHAGYYPRPKHDDEVNMHTFRELVNRKAYIPRVFHNWIHYITEPPPIPTDEVMQYSIDAQRVAMSLAHTASLAVRLTRIARMPEKKLLMRLDQEFEHYAIYLDNAREVPEEFSLIAIHEIEAKSAEEMLIANKRLGRLALHTVPTRHRAILSGA